MVLPDIKRHLNEKNALSDNDSIHGHRNLNDTERSLVARHRNFNAPKICQLTVDLCIWSCTLSSPLNQKNNLKDDLIGTKKRGSCRTEKAI